MCDVFDEVAEVSIKLSVIANGIVALDLVVFGNFDLLRELTSFPAFIFSQPRFTYVKIRSN